MFRIFRRYRKKEGIFSILQFFNFSVLMLMACTETVSDATQENVLPQIYPDYTGVTVPVNIAPLCFNMADETVLQIDAVVTDSHGGSLHAQGEESVDIDLDEWHTLLVQNSGESLSVVVSAK